MIYNSMLPLMTLTFILLNILLYVLILVISTCFSVFTNSDIAHLFLSGFEKEFDLIVDTSI